MTLEVTFSYFQKFGNLNLKRRAMSLLLYNGEAEIYDKCIIQNSKSPRTKQLSLSFNEKFSCIYFVLEGYLLYPKVT